MSTFLEFYETLTKFVLFKLYASENITYPPKVLEEVVGEQSFSYNAIDWESLENDAEAEREEEKYQIDDEFQESNPTLQKIMGKDKNSSTANAKKGLFAGMVFFLSTEVPRTAFEFMVLSCGGQAVSD